MYRKNQSFSRHILYYAYFNIICDCYKMLIYIFIIKILHFSIFFFYFNKIYGIHNLMKKLTFLIILLFLSTFGKSYAELTAGKFTNNPDVDAFVNKMNAKHGFSKDYLYDVFNKTMHSGFTPKYMNKPAESVNTWKVYRTNMINDARIGLGIRYFKEHKTELIKAQKQFGVPAHIIAGVIGMETNYGYSPMKFRAVDSIATLAFYYPRRSEYFQRELEALFLFARKTDTDIFDIKSSYAGAIGIPQFMPSNVLTYAVSGTGNKHIDIINNHLDALYSVANFLKKKGWKTGELVSMKVQVKGKKYYKYVTESPCNGYKVTVKTLKNAGVSFPYNVSDDTKATLFTVQGANGKEFHAAFNNFCAIYRYNPSIHYALGVNYLGNIVGSRSGAVLYSKYK